MDDIFSFENLYADEGVPDELYRLVRDGLDTELENRLKELPNCQEHLQAVRWYGQEQFSLLMLAAYYGYDHIVRLLLDIDPSTEHVQLYGKFYIEEQEERLAGATALYCACYRGHFQVAKTLIDIGHADVDDVTLDRSDLPLLLQATIHNRLDIIRFLIENGYADVNKTKSLDRRKYNALFYAVENNCTSVIEYLLDHGVDINYKISVHDMQTRALGRAIELNHVESFNLLCQRGAHLVYQNQSDDDGDDIKSAILNSTAYSIIQFFLEEKFIDVKDLELEACDVIARSSNMESNERIVDLLRFALQYRRRTGLTKSSAPLQSFYKFHQECQTIDELDSLINNRERTLIEGILILERLCPSRKEKLFTLIEEYGTLLCSHKDYETCLDLWLHLAEIDQQFNGDYGTHLFVWYFCQLLNDKRTISVSRFLQAVYFIIKKENVSYGEKDLNNALFLVIIATKILQQPTITSVEKIAIFQWIQQICQLKPLRFQGKTMLHLCVDRKTNSNLTFRAAHTTPHISFPNAQGVYLLLNHGAQWLDVNTMDSMGNTSLHIVCKETTPNQKVIGLLLYFGAHLDCRNKDRKQPADYVLRQPHVLALLRPKVEPSRLKCLCALKIIQEKLKDDQGLSLLPSSLQTFLHLHGYVSL